MSATLLDRSSKTPETFVPCADCPALQRVKRELAELRREVSELRRAVGYWKSRHADAVGRIEQLKEELRQSRGQVRALQGKLFGRKSEMRALAAEERSDPKLRQPCRKVLESLAEHWTGLARFVDDPRIPLDNNASERAGRGPAVARKNFYGSGSLWSGRLAVAMFSLFATLAHWKLNPRLWLLWYLESCATAGGKAPENIEPFLPWNLSAERRAALAMRITTPATDTS